MPFKHASSNSTSIQGSVPNDTKVCVREFPSSVSHKRYGTTVLDDDSDVGVHPIISSIVQSVQNSPTLSGVLLSVMEIMDMLPTPPDAAEALAAIGHRIYRAFESLSHEDEDSFSSALVNESQRFGLWAKNVGLYNLGLTSLDHKFRDAPVVYEYNMCWGRGLPSSGKLGRSLQLTNTCFFTLGGDPRNPPFPPGSLRGLSEGSSRALAEGAVLVSSKSCYLIHYIWDFELASTTPSAEVLEEPSKSSGG